MAVGHKPFGGISPASALETLRRYLHRLGVHEARWYRTHDIRRGHADDLRESGASLYELLSAGEWSSPAYMSYLNMQELEAAVVLEAHVEDLDVSSSEEGVSASVF